MRFGSVLVVAFSMSLTVGCRQPTDLDQSKRQIIDLHRSLIQAHLDKDAAALAEPTAADYLSVANGDVRTMSAADVEAMLAPYLAATEFSHYEDVAEPIVGISEDGSIAWSIVQVRVAGERNSDDNTVRAFDTKWAWLTLYRRTSEGWERFVDVSTNRPFR